MTTALDMKPEEWRKFNPSKNIKAKRARKEYLNDRREKALKVPKRPPLCFEKSLEHKK